MFCNKCRYQMRPEHSFCDQCEKKLVEEEITSSEWLLQELEKELERYPQLSAVRSDQTVLEIEGVLATAQWGVGKKKVEYNACLNVNESENIVVFCEIIKETEADQGFWAGFRFEKYKVAGKSISDRVREVGYGPQGKLIDYNWDYAQTRQLVEGLVRSNGWKFKIELMKKECLVTKK